MRGSDAAVLTLKQLGVDVIFGLCGDTTLPLYESLHELDHGIRHVLTRDERGASFMADAYARFSGKVGVCEGPSGGGATYILPGVAEANESSVPLVCLTSDIDQTEAGRGTLTELDQCALFRPVTRATMKPAGASQLPRDLRRAFRAATTGRMGAAHVALPYDVQMGTLSTDALEEVVDASSYPATRPTPKLDEVRAAAKRLVEATNPMIIAGAGVIRSGAWEELTALAHLLGIPVATSICGKGAIAETDPYALGVIGSNGGLAYRHELVRAADLLFYVGCGQGSVTTEKWTLPASGDTRVLQLDIDANRIGVNYETEIGLVGDAQATLAAVIHEVDALVSGRAQGKVDPQMLASRRQDAWSRFETLSNDETPIRPERLVSELSKSLPETALLCVDPGTGCPYLSAYYPLPRAGRWFVSPRAHGALGYALPGVCGAYLSGRETQRVVGIMGDGSFGISCGDLETLVRLRIPATLIVLNNSSFGWIKAGQRTRGGKYFSVDFSDTNHAAVAQAFGMQARRVEDPSDLGPALSEGLRSEGPYLLDVVVQPLHEAAAPVSKWIA